LHHCYARIWFSGGTGGFLGHQRAGLLADGSGVESPGPPDCL